MARMMMVRMTTAHMTTDLMTELIFKRNSVQYRRETSEKGMHIEIWASPFRTLWGNEKGKRGGMLGMNEMFEKRGNCLTIYLPKELDHPVSDQIRRESDRIMKENYIKNIVFDFSDTMFMDSSGIGLIMGRYRALGMRGNCLRAVHVNARIDKLLHLSGVHKFLEILDK